MASSTATLSAVLTLDDRASPGLVRTSQNSEKLRASLLSTGQAVATFASSMASLLVTTGALNSKTGQYATAAFAVSGAVISLIGPLIQLNRVMKESAVIQAFLTTLKNPIAGAAIVAGAAAVAGVAAYTINRISASNADRNARRSAASDLFGDIQARSSGPQIIDLRGATIRGEDDLNEISRRLSRNVPPNY